MIADRKIVEGLLRHDEKITRDFFYEQCRPLFLSIIKSMFDYAVEYDEFVNEIYVLLMENDGQRLRQFNYESSVFQWLKTTTIRHFLKRREEVIEDRSKEPLYEEQNDGTAEDETRQEARADLERLLGQMHVERYAYVIRRLIIEDADPETVANELRTKVVNVYNIKKRAIAKLSELAVNDVRIYNNE